MGDHAEFIGLFRTLFIIFAAYWGFKWVVKYVLPGILKLLIAYLGNKAKGNFDQRGFNSSGNKNSDEENISDDGKVSIKKSKSKQSPSKSFDNIGDFIDYEELDD